MFAELSPDNEAYFKHRRESNSSLAEILFLLWLEQTTGDNNVCPSSVPDISFLLVPTILNGRDVLGKLAQNNIPRS